MEKGNEKMTDSDAQINVKAKSFFDSIFTYCYGALSFKKENNNTHREIEINDVEVLKKIAINSNSVECVSLKKINESGSDVKYLFSILSITSEIVNIVKLKSDFDFVELHVISSEKKLENYDELFPYYFDLLLSARDYENNLGE